MFIILLVLSQVFNLNGSVLSNKSKKNWDVFIGKTLFYFDNGSQLKKETFFEIAQFDRLGSSNISNTSPLHLELGQEIKYAHPSKHMWINKIIQRNFHILELERQNHLLKSIFIILLSFFLIAFIFIRFFYFRYRLDEISRLHNIELIKKYLKGKEEERSKIAIELHDEIANELIALTFTEDLKMRQELIIILDRIRTLSHELSDVTFQNVLSLKEIFDFNIKKYFRENKYLVYFEWPEYLPDYSFKEKNNNIHFQRIIQELCVNIKKHSNSTIVNFTISANPDELNVNVSDNGKGFDMTSVKHGIGLKNIKMRIEQMKLNYVLSSNKKTGTTFTMKLPFIYLTQISNENSYSR